MSKGFTVVVLRSLHRLMGRRRDEARNGPFHVSLFLFTEEFVRDEFRVRVSETFGHTGSVGSASAMDFIHYCAKPNHG
jgi:hypothetical protein